MFYSVYSEAWHSQGKSGDDSFEWTMVGIQAEGVSKSVFAKAEILDI